MQTIKSDVSQVTLLRKRLARAARSMKVIGVLSVISFLSLLAYIRAPFIVALALGILVFWFAFRLSNRLGLGETSAEIFVALWVVVVLALQLFSFLSNGRWKDFIFYSIPIYFVIRGILHLRAYKSGLPSNPGKFGLFTSHPWENRGQSVRKHPKFLNKSSFWLYVYMILVFYISMGILVVLTSPASGSEPAVLAGEITFIVVASMWLLSVPVAYLYRRGRRHAMLSGDKMLKKDKRKLVLYLRSFMDDTTIKMRARANDGRIFLERFVKIPFEELVTDHLWRYGPVVAIGDPSTAFRKFV